MYRGTNIAERASEEIATRPFNTMTNIAKRMSQNAYRERSRCRASLHSIPPRQRPRRTRHPPPWPARAAAIPQHNSNRNSNNNNNNKLTVTWPDHDDGHNTTRATVAKELCPPCAHGRRGRPDDARLPPIRRNSNTNSESSRSINNCCCNHATHVSISSRTI